MGQAKTIAKARESEKTEFSVFSSVSLSYLVAAALLAGLVWAGGLWNLLANTRILALFYRAGIVALTDADQGLAQGAPSPDYFLASQDPVDWVLVPIALLILVAMWNLRGLLFATVANIAGSPASTGDHNRAFLYGNGMNMLLPYRLGNVASAASLETRGVSVRQAAQASFVLDVLVVLSIVVFALIGMFTVGGTTGLTQLLWDEFLLLIAYLIVRGTGLRRRRAGGGVGWFRSARDSLTALAQDPAMLLKLVAIALFTFALDVLAAYVISQAFTGSVVILNVDFRILMMGVIAGYIASLIPVTPGGIGQYEWGFAAALYIGGVGIPEAVTIAVLHNLFRWLTALLLMWFARRRGGVETNMRSVSDLIRRRQAEVAS